MYFGPPRRWGGTSSRSSELHKPGKGKAKRDKRTKNRGPSRSKDESSSDNDPHSDNEGPTPVEGQRSEPFQGLGNGLRDVGSFLWEVLSGVLSNPHVRYLMPWVLLSLVGIQLPIWLGSHAPGGGFWDNVTAMSMAQPVSWPMVITAAINAVPAVLGWWSADSVNKTTTTIPQVQFLSPISAEEASVIPEYLPIVESSIARLSVMDVNPGLSRARKESFRRAMEEAKVLKGINDGLMTDVKLRFSGHYRRLAQIHADIERAIIDIADREQPKRSSPGGWFTKDWPYARAKSHHRILQSITDGMTKASNTEAKRLRRELKKLDAFVTDEEHHGAICGFRSRTLKSIRIWSKATRDIRAEVQVMCDSARRSKVKLDKALDALKEHRNSIGAVFKGLSKLQHDQAETLEMALLSYCKALIEAMQKLAEFGNG